MSEDKENQEAVEVVENLDTEKVEGAEGQKASQSEEVREDADSVLARGDSPDFKWYIAKTFTNQENKVQKALRENIINHNLADYFAKILVPEETVISHAGGKRRSLKKKFFPGYILIKMIMSEKTWHLVKNTDKITGFVGGSADHPSPISEEEAAYMTNQLEDGFKSSRTLVEFGEGDQVKVKEGPFASFVGTVEAVTDKKIKVNVSIFGRLTPVELEVGQVEKV